MTTIELTGTVVMIGAPYMMPKSTRQAQKIILEVNYQDAREKTDLFAVFLYGKDCDPSGRVWSGYRHQGSRRAKMLCKLGGRYKNQKDSLTLTLKKIIWL